MKRFTAKAVVLSTIALLLGSALLLLLLMPAKSAAEEWDRSGGLTPRQSEPAVVEPPLVWGAYTGTVAITMPTHLGVLDLAFRLDERLSQDQLAGAIAEINSPVFSRTLILPGDPPELDLLFTVTGAVNGITPTFSLRSGTIRNTMSGLTITRHLVVKGEVWQDGQVLSGEYSEQIVGLTPDPITLEGLFMAARAPIDETSQSPEFTSIYLPLILLSH